MFGNSLQAAIKSKVAPKQSDSNESEKDNDDLLNVSELI